MSGRGFLARRVWQRNGFLPWLLWMLAVPLSLIYATGVQLRNLFYSSGWLHARELTGLVVSVGNLTVGGTGKTPTTLWLARELAVRGYRVAILSRGYRRRGSGVGILDAGFEPFDDSGDAGDEPAVMAALYGHRVGVGKMRYEAGIRLLQDGPVDIFLLDDGFQHRRLHRDVDLLLLGEDWQGCLLPAGPFREPKSASRRAHICVITGSRTQWDAILTRDPERPVRFYGRLEPTGVIFREDYHWVGASLSKVSEGKVLAVSGIANAGPFYRMIRDADGDIVDALEFPDHHEYSTKDWQIISRRARNVDRVITTEKDIVKLVRFPFAKDRLCALRVGMVVQEGERLIGALEDSFQAKRSLTGSRRSDA